MRRLALVLALLLPGLAAAEPAPVSVATAVTSDAGVVLVGPSAQIYEPVGELRWQRRGAGGVAVDVIGATRARDGTLYAVGKRTPLFARRGGVWFALPLPNRGAVSFSDGAIAIAVGRHVYGLEDGRWHRLTSARQRITALWAAGDDRFYAATTDGGLSRSNGRRWDAIASPRSAGDPITRLVGVAGKELYGITASGLILAVGRSATTPVTIDAALTGFVPEVAGVARDAVHVAGHIERDGARRFVLAVLRGGRLEAAGELWQPAAGDRFAALFAADGKLAVVTAGGDVRALGEDGSWQQGQVEASPPQPPPGAQAAAPARTR